jgi:asparagine synthase (glutamine-hydrolysing)
MKPEPPVTRKRWPASSTELMLAVVSTIDAMCGICGVVALGRPAETDAVAAMARALDHRGPDGDGAFDAEGVALGFRRLAIIDLTDAGMQPFASDDGALRLVHNGEIYNYRELRRELEARGRTFRSQSDTEVVLRAYEEWGDECVRRFNGMWALALWDGRRRRLFCSRDRFGIKPFYYSFARRRLAFASEPKAFRADHGTRLEASPSAIRDYLGQGYADHTAGTFFASVERLPAAHNLVLDEGGLRLEQYWRLEEAEPPVGDAAEAVREAFLDALRVHLRSDVPVGTCLSGGIDSSAVVVGVDHLLQSEHMTAAAVGERQRTFTAYFEDAGFDERPFAQAVVERMRVEPHWVTLGDSEVVDLVPRIVEMQDEPTGSTSVIAQWAVLRAAREGGLTVMLDGQGADEIFAGYHAYFSPFYADLLTSGRVGTLVQELRAYRSLHGASTPQLAEMVMRRFVPDRVRWLARGRARGGSVLVHPDLRGGYTPEPNGAVFHDRTRRLLHLILTARGLPELLRYEDRNSMAHSLEARVPFLDVRLVELLFSLRSDELIRNGRTKDVLRRALGDLLPPVVRDRTDKLGFVTPEARWLRGPLGELAADVFASASFRDRGWVDAAAARARLDRHRRGELDAGFELWRALNLELWARAYVDA